MLRLKAIADALGTTLSELVTLEGERPAPPLPDWRSNPGAIAELYRHAGTRQQELVVELLVGRAPRHA